MRITPIREYNGPDLDRIRQVAGNTDLAEADIFDFGTFLIARSGVNKNGTDITAEGQKAAASAWVGKPIYFRDHETNSSNQIGRIYSAWTVDDDAGTRTYGKGYGVRTDDLADIFKRIDGGIHREMSCGYEPVRSVCSACGSDLDAKSFSTCPKGHRLGVDGVYARDLEFTPDHVSFVGRPAVEGAGLISGSAITERLGAALRRCGVSPDAMVDRNAPPPSAADVDRLSQLAEDGVEFRRWAADEFRCWYQRSNPTATADEVATLTAKLAAREMVALARIERQRFAEVMPDGKQISTTTAKAGADEPVEVADEPPPTYRDFKDIFRDLKRTYSRLEGKE